MLAIEQSSMGGDAPHGELVKFGLSFDSDRYEHHRMNLICPERDFLNVQRLTIADTEYAIPHASDDEVVGEETYRLPEKFARGLIDFIKDERTKKKLQNCFSFVCNAAGVSVPEYYKQTDMQLEGWDFEEIGPYEALEVGDIVRMAERGADAKRTSNADHWYMAANQVDRTALHVVGCGSQLMLTRESIIQKIYPDRQLYIATPEL